MKIDPEAFITRHLDQIIPEIITQSPLNQVVGPVSWLWPQVRRADREDSEKQKTGMGEWFGPLGCK